MLPEGLVLGAQLAVFLAALVKVVTHDLDLAVEPRQGAVEIVEAVGEAVDLRIGLRRLDDHRLAGLTALEDDRADLLHRLFHAVETRGGALVQRLVEGNLSEGRRRESEGQGQGEEDAGRIH